MKRFSFQLDPVLSLREQLERQAQQALASELAHQLALNAELAEAARRVREAQRSGLPAPGPARPAVELQAAQAYRERLERDQRIARATLADQELQVAAERDRLVRAARDRETLRRLKERRQHEHARAAARVEEAGLAEVALAGHRRRVAAGGAA